MQTGHRHDTSMKFTHRRFLGPVLLLPALALLASCRLMAPPPAKPSLPFIRAEGARTVTESGAPIVLKGCNLGNWFQLELWMLEINEVRDQYSFESVLTERFGRERKDELMELFRENWITERDFELVRSFGFNVVRLPFHYSLLEDDEHPMQLRPDAFKWLDRAVAMAERHGLYVILDLHGAPGGQSKDHTTGHEDQNKLFGDEALQQRTVWLWTRIAEHFKDSPTVAAYEPLNEPFGEWDNEQKHTPALLDVVSRIYKAIRSVDPKHLVVIPGSLQGVEFYGRPRDRGWHDVIFTEHYYPGVHTGQKNPSLEAHKELINRVFPWLESYLKKVETPFFIGEFNVVFRSAGGPVMMRHYYDLFASKGWWATMWSHKVLNKDGALSRDNWYLVTNGEPPPRISLKTSSFEEIQSWCKWLGAMPYAVYEDLRQALTSDAPERIVLENPPSNLAAPARDPLGDWQGADIAAVLAGGQRVYSPAQMDVYGGGRDVWNDHDEFRFVSQPVGGDFELAATITDLEDVNPFAKAGVMLRVGLDPDAPHILVHVFPTAQVVVGWRAADGGITEEKKFPVAQFPVRLRIRRSGDSVETAFAVAGGDWVQGPAFTPGWLGGKCRAGLAVLSHDSRYVARAAFSEIELKQKGASREP